MSRKFVAYFRVSTKKQSLGLDAQREAVERYIAQAGGQLLAPPYVERESGTSHENRIELHKAIAKAKEENAVLCIAKLDRLARNVAFISQLMDSGVEFVACDNPHANRMTIQIMAVMAEQEARFIQERTVAGLAALKQRGVTKTGKPVRLGNPNNGTPEQTKRMHDGAKAKADAYAQSIIGEIRKWQAKGITTYKDLADILTGKFPTPRGAEVWQATQVRRIIDRAVNLQNLVC
ncbi:recombinase family protein [Microvirga sp. BSC39]|uniref:recombinase family protein n=1 Tax=Microvirga sp. BSC39 TaxID=1549810 RepID=UPI00068B9873|nr:recombinase family protein [Microvirga sp. BSC39]